MDTCTLFLLASCPSLNTSLPLIAATAAALASDTSPFSRDWYFAPHLEEAGYTVGLFGKYLNEMPKTVPPGFDAWL